jgi:serine/threonine protein kinase
MNAVIERTSTPITGSEWLDHYQLLRLLKNGGMSKVYLAYDTYTHQHVAIKVMERGRFNEEFFLSEVRLMRSLNHPNILPLLAARRSGQWNYIVMPYIAGGTLQERISEHIMTPEEVSLILTQLIDALQYMHACGIIHRDIKPGNILLDGNTVYITDFGIAVQQEEEIAYFDVDEPILGTPIYMAPEMYEGEISRQGDLYALGIVLYQMLTGSVPFDDKQVANIYWKQKTERPLSPALLNPYISSPLERVMLRSLAREPEGRFQTAAAFAIAYQKAFVPSLMERLFAIIAKTLRTMNPYRCCPACSKV